MAASSNTPVIDLTPKWPPLATPPMMVPDGTAPFPILVDTASGVVVVGGQMRVCVFQVFDRQRLWYSVPGFKRLSGFTIHEGRLYLCDGPVLSAWSLADALTIADKIWGRCLAAINVVTGQTIDPVAAETSREPTSDIYGVPDGGTHVLSPPVIKVNEMGGAPGGMVFVLGSDNKLRALDSGLSATTEFDTAYPMFFDGVPQLAVIEDADNASCKLFYVDTLGAIVGIDASTRTLRALGQWEHPPERNFTVPGRYEWKVLPPQGADGMLWTAAIPTPPHGLMMFAPVPGSTHLRVWTDKPMTSFEVAPAEKLVLISDGTTRRMLSYQGGIPNAINGQPYPADWFVESAQMTPVEKPAWTVFWPHAEGTAEDAPRLIFEVDRAADGAKGTFGYRVYFGMTAQVRDKAHASAFSPFAKVLVSGTLSFGSFAGREPRSVAIANAPAIVNDQLFALVQCEGGALLLASFVLREVATRAYPVAAAEIAHQQQMLTPLTIRIDEVIVRPNAKGPTAPIPWSWVWLVFPDGSSAGLYTDQNGEAVIDGIYGGREVTGLLLGRVQYNMPLLHHVTLQNGTTNTVTVGPN